MFSVLSHHQAFSPRLYVPAVFYSYRRSRRITRHHTSLLKIDGVTSSEDAMFYVGKKVAYVYKTPSGKARTIWGNVTKVHGNSGAVRAKFHHNLPGQALGCPVKVMMYPNRNPEL